MHTQTQQHPKAVTSAVAAAYPDTSSPRTVFSTVALFCKRNEGVFTEPSVRNLIFKAEPRESSLGVIPGNGLVEAGAIVRLGRKVLINEERFFAWVQAQGGAK